MIAQVLERRDEVVAQTIGARPLFLGARVGWRDIAEAILQLEHDALRGLLPDPWNPGEARDVGALHGDDELAAFDAREHRDGELRPDAADADQALEQQLFERREESKELQH